MSGAGPAALALKTQSRLSAADNDFAATAAAGQALNVANAAAAAAPAAAAAAPARPAAYDFQAYRIASASLPAQPAAVSSTGRRPSQPLAAFQGDVPLHGLQGGQGIRKRGRPSSGTGEYKCEACGKRFKQKGSITNYHMKEWDVVGADGVVTKERLCRTRDSAKIQLLEARGKAAQQQSGQGIASFFSPAAGSGAPSLTHILCRFCWIYVQLIQLIEHNFMGVFNG